MDPLDNNITKTPVETPADEKVSVDYAKMLEGVDINELIKQDSIQQKIQSIADARVTEALKTARSKWTAEAEAQKSEAAKLSKMTAEEKAHYEFQKQVEAFKAEKAEYERQLLQLETAKQLQNAGLPDLSQYITGKNADDTAANIQELANVLGAWKQSQMQNILKGQAPRDINNTPHEITDADIAKMSQAEITALVRAGKI